MKAKMFAATLMIAPLLGFVALKTIGLEPTSSLYVEGSSTVRGWKCQAQKLDAQIVAESGAKLSELVKGATVVIPVEQLNCGNNTMNEHMRKALKATENKDIRFKLASYDVNGSAATLKGELEIAGVSRPIEIPATVSEADGAVRVKASKIINMKEWGVKPPSLMMGTMKVKENATVNFDVAVKP